MWDGNQWVANPNRPAPQPEKKKHTVRNIILGLILLFVLFIGGCMALIGGAANEVDKAIKEDANKSGGTDNPMEITEGEAFDVDGFDYSEGWELSNEYKLASIENFKVTNNRDDQDSAFIYVKLWQGTEAVTVIHCSTEQIPVGTTTSLDCGSDDDLAKDYDKITINDTF